MWFGVGEWYSDEISAKNLPYSMEFNSSGRIVVASAFVDWDDSDNGWPTKWSIRESLDYGVTWGPVYTMFMTYQTNSYDTALTGICITESSDGAIWVAFSRFDPDIQPRWSNPSTVYARYDIYKYIQGSDPVFVRSISTGLYSTWDGSHNENGYGLDVRNCNIYAEGTKIVVAYVHSFIHSIPVGTPDRDGLARVYIDVSNDSGATWATQEVILPGGESILWSPNWLTLMPSVCISDGNILIYLLKGTGRESSLEPRIVRSTDDGATWSTVYTFPSYSMNYPWVFQLRSDGEHVTGTGCGAAILADSNLALWESLDAGATWAANEMVPTLEPQIIVPI
jgi:hypothetical protein